MFIWTLTFIAYVTTINSIKFKNIATETNGLKYSRTYGSKWDEIIEPFLNGGAKPDSIPILRQHPGVAVFDYDNDGDMDIFVTNGPETQHSLFQNQLVQTGGVSFIDVAVDAGFGGIESVQQDGSGVCYGDVDNDGDNDILILGNAESNFLYENNGDGTFTFLQDSGITSQKRFHSTSCSFGDIDNDGFIDVVIANSADTTDISAISGISIMNKLNNVQNDPWQYNEFNELYHNNGDNTFTDISDRIQSTVFDDNSHNYNGTYNGKPTITWAIEMVDINDDGYIDIVHADDTLGLLPPFGVPKGIVHIFFNKGNGEFIDVPNTVFGYFMGNSAADINCDNNMDLFLTDFGGVQSSRWYFGDGKGRFTPTNRKFDEEVTDMVISPFGWGNAIFDYDNDADLDIIYHGGMEGKHKIVANNPGVIFENTDGCFTEYTVPPPEQLFDVDSTCVDENNTAIPECTIHVRRNVQGLAIGDLNNDGFYDIVTTSNAYFGTDFPPPYIPQYSIFKRTAFFGNYSFYFKHYINPISGKPESWRPKRGDIAVEIADKSNNNNNYFHITVKGSKGILSCGNVNRDAIGAVLNVYVDNRENKSVTIPIEGGSSYLSQHSLQKIFGMGSGQTANLLVKYPYKHGGYIVNKLNKIKPFENLILYEIPCDYKSRNEHLDKYSQCVQESLCNLRRNGFIDESLTNRLYNSAFDSNDKTIECNEGMITYCGENDIFDAFRIPQIMSAVDAQIELAEIKPLAHQTPGCQTVIVELQTDDFASEISFEIVDDSTGLIVESQGFGSISNGFFEFTYVLDGDHCYTFEIFDSFGDGICCVFGVGNYRILIDGTEAFVSPSGGAYGSSESWQFCLDECSCENPGPVELCKEQADCLKVSYNYTKIPGKVVVCTMYDSTKPLCCKEDSSSISHACWKDEDGTSYKHEGKGKGKKAGFEHGRSICIVDDCTALVDHFVQVAFKDGLGCDEQIATTVTIDGAFDPVECSSASGTNFCDKKEDQCVYKIPYDPEGCMEPIHLNEVNIINNEVAINTNVKNDVIGIENIGSASSSSSDSIDNANAIFDDNSDTFVNGYDNKHLIITIGEGDTFPSNIVIFFGILMMVCAVNAMIYYCWCYRKEIKTKSIDMDSVATI